jgi:hypothetical protein
VRQVRLTYADGSSVELLPGILLRHAQSGGWEANAMAPGSPGFWFAAPLGAEDMGLSYDPGKLFEPDDDLARLHEPVPGGVAFAGVTTPRVPLPHDGDDYYVHNPRVLTGRRVVTLSEPCARYHFVVGPGALLHHENPDRGYGIGGGFGKITKPIETIRQGADLWTRSGTHAGVTLDFIRPLPHEIASQPERRCFSIPLRFSENAPTIPLCVSRADIVMK